MIFVLIRNILKRLINTIYGSLKWTSCKCRLLCNRFIINNHCTLLPSPGFVYPTKVGFWCIRKYNFCNREKGVTIKMFKMLPKWGVKFFIISHFWEALFLEGGVKAKLSCNPAASRCLRQSRQKLHPAKVRRQVHFYWPPFWIRLN